MELSDLHSTLSDIKSESGAFDQAAEELQKALEYATKIPKADLRW
jgi:hypothetical protein